jgi:[ribosomal protein S5]-alanine N-acetyltransferase
MEVIGKRIVLRLLSSEEVSAEYVEWMRDPDITQFLESRWTVYEFEDLKDYVKRMNSSLDNFLFGIFLRTDFRHIGNIKIGGIDHTHRFADVGLLIGNKKYHGYGYGSEAIKLATECAFNQLNLNKLVAGIYAPNLASYRAFAQAGYREVGIFKNHRFYKGSYVDEVIMERSKQDAQ